ncbi:hypothetical protein [Sphingomonas sp. CROZ-RG-20F-R02-07]|uniref:hypothetical protein n=1 Tax=Sphingomonas sp. CROZ-RG-20F-R02-07 TaxID=2914832 RepID=UPI001F57BAE5|nr:hypothetical protein [Sphingomonas sp. CROZ-RG-20F-R02-07]
MTLAPRTIHAAYYAAHIGKSLLWTASDLVTIYALVTLFGVDPALAGWLFLGGLAVNAFADLFVGDWLDRHPRQTRAVAGIGLAGTAMVFPLTILTAPSGSAALIAATLAFRLCYAAYDVPHNAMLTRLAATAAGAATRLSRGRTVGTGIAAGAVGLALSRWRDALSLPVMLWLLAGAALILGSALLPLLPRAAALRAAATSPIGPGLPTGFLVGSLIGIVALSALTKAMLQLPPAIANPGAGTTVLLLTGGRMLAALVPFGVRDARRGLTLLASLYLIAIPIMAQLLRLEGWPMILAIGLLLGSTNLVDWTLLPLLARGARSYGFYTMAAKLALGGAGLAMTAALGNHTTFAPGAFAAFVAGVLAACALAAWCVWPRGAFRADRRKDVQA